MALSLTLLLLCPVVLGTPFTHWYYLPENDLYQPLNLTWADARSRCQALHTSLYTLDLVPFLTLHSITQGLEMVWVGLQRNQNNDLAWSWIDTGIVEPTTGDISQTLTWSAANGSGHCAFYNSHLTWSSKPCDEPQTYFCSSPSGVQHNKETLSWSKAREACLSSGQELFTILNNDDAEAIKKKAEGTELQGWIGLYRVGGDTWEWAGGQTLSYTDWAQGEPVTRDCGAWSVVDQSWTSFSCDSAFQAICHKEALNVVTQMKTWEEALEHCAGLGLQLLVLRDREDYDYVRRRIRQRTTEQVWLGLRFLAGHWWWVDGSAVRQDLPLCPEPSQACGIISTSSSLEETALTADCSKKLNFICYNQTGPVMIP